MCECKHKVEVLKNKIQQIDKFLISEENEAATRMGANPDYFQAVVSTVYKIRSQIKKI